jgi:hypothetical protein
MKNYFNIAKRVPPPEPAQHGPSVQRWMKTYDYDRPGFLGRSCSFVTYRM